MFLAIDTSNGISSLCLFKENTIMHYIEDPNMSSESIASMFANLLKNKQIDVNDIKAIFSALGPGSFTGIKSCVSFAKVLGFAINCPVYGFSSLNIIAADFLNKNPTANNIIASINAYNKSTYVQTFNNNLKPITSIEKIANEDIQNFLSKNNNAKIAGYQEESNNPSYSNSLAIAKLALKNLPNLENFKDLTPFYLQNPYKKLNEKNN